MTSPRTRQCVQEEHKPGLNLQDCNPGKRPQLAGTEGETEGRIQELT